MKKILFLITFIFIITNLLSENDKEKSITYERTQKLKWGIDTDVIELLKKLKSEEDNSFSNVIFDRFKKSLQPKIKIECIDYFKYFKYLEVNSILKDIIKNSFDHDPSLVIASLKYFSNIPDDNIIEFILPLIENNDINIAIQSINTLGKIKNPVCVSELHKQLKNTDYNSSLKPNIVLALGEIGSDESVDILIEILNNDDEDGIIRRYSCDSLGKIGNPKCIDSLMEAYIKGDLLLRSYAISSLGYFSSPEVLSVLIDSLTDSSLKIRIAGIKGLAHQKIDDNNLLNEILDGLIFKAKNDPEMKVQLEAINSIGEIKFKRSSTFLLDLYKNKKISFILRAAAFDKLSENFINESIKTFEIVIKMEWGEKNSKILDYTCKKLSLIKNNNLKDIFALLLTHNSFIIQIYGIRGTGKNKFSEFRNKIEELSKKTNKSLRREALYTLEKL